MLCEGGRPFLVDVDHLVPPRTVVRVAVVHVVSGDQDHVSRAEADDAAEVAGENGGARVDQPH